jgi:hypothetical protein
MIGQTPEPADAQAGPDQALPGEGTNVPVPEAAPVRLDPTRYGDWERNGRCIDF